ncbi:SMC family ATPase, partial [Candidatus Bathyarchaeota archaeon]|nr:SMC family ATPase [Candidatus Bathyarchaeota archaeon]
MLKALRLKNIRSYVDQTIEFPLGTTLFEGDIGSGKSTILMAIEFALFGLGSERGASLLRIGASEGAVGLTFEVDGREYTIVRTIRRKGRGVQQGEGYLKTPEEGLYLSPTELKEKVLQILSFKEPPDPKARSLIYRYAIFTPQEEMKGILTLPQDLRLQTIRKALGIEDYRIAMENASAIAKEIRQKSLEFEIKSGDLEALKKDFRERKEKLEENEGRWKILKAEEELTAQKVEERKKELESFQDKKAEIMAIRSRIPILKDRLEEILSEMEEALSERRECEEKIKDLETKIEAFNQLQPPTSKSEEDLLLEIRRLEVEERSLREFGAILRRKAEELEEIEKRGICPTCERRVDPKEFEDKIRLKRLEEAEAYKKIVVAVEALKASKELLEALKAYKTAAKENQRDMEELQAYLRRSGELEDRIESLQKRQRELKQELEGAEKDVAKLQEILSDIASKEAELQKEEGRLLTIRRELSRLEGTIGEAKKALIQSEEEIKRREALLQKARRLREYTSWLEDYFIPTLGAIERQALLSNNLEFNES